MLVTGKAGVYRIPICTHLLFVMDFQDTGRAEGQLIQGSP